MPLYTFQNVQNDEVIEMNMKIADREKWLRKNPEWKQIITKAPTLGDSVRLGLRKHDDGFNDVLKNIKSHHYKSNINTK